MRFRQGFVAGGLAVWLALQLLDRVGKAAIGSERGMPGEATRKLVAGMDHDKLVRLHNAVDVELLRRKSS